MTGIWHIVADQFVTCAAALSVVILYGIRQRRALARQKLETLRLLRAEFVYWTHSGEAAAADDEQKTIAIGATGAVSNVMAAVMGHPAPWHKQESCPDKLERK